MKLIDEELLKRVRTQRCCWCGKPPPSDAAHILSKGAGRVDIKENLLPLCRAHHRSSHDGNQPTTEDLLAISAARNGCLQDDIRAAVYAVRRKAKEPTCRPKKKRKR